MDPVNQKRKAHYIYVVTRLVTPREGQRGVVAVPNLGAFRYCGRAIEHFEAVMADRLERGFKLHWTRGREWDLKRGRLSEEEHRRNPSIIAAAYLTSEDPRECESEELRVEGWRVQGSIK